MAVCSNHQEKAASVNCAICGKPVCRECIVGNFYCSAACMTRGTQSIACAGDVIDKRRVAKKPSAAKKVLLFIILLTIAAGVIWYYANNKKTLDHKARTLINSIDQKNRDLIKSGQYRVQDTEYKRSRERLVQ